MVSEDRFFYMSFVLQHWHSEAMRTKKMINVASCLSELVV